MRGAYFAHSLRSCGSYGNAHFLRGVLRELIAAGHGAEAFEPAGGWSAQNLVADAGPDVWGASQASYTGLRTTMIDAATMIRATGADSMIVHGWNEPALVAALGTARKQGGVTLLFHDTHPCAVSDPDAMRRNDPDGYDGVLPFGEALASFYRGWGWGARVFTWHEAADTQLFRPPATETSRHGACQTGRRKWRPSSSTPPRVVRSGRSCWAAMAGRTRPCPAPCAPSATLARRTATRSTAWRWQC